MEERAEGVGDWVAKEEAKGLQMVYRRSRACDDLGFLDGHFVKFLSVWLCCGLEMCGHDFQSRCMRICCRSVSRTGFNSSIMTLNLMDLGCEKNGVVVGSSKMFIREVFLHSALHVLLPRHATTHCHPQSSIMRWGPAGHIHTTTTT